MPTPNGPRCPRKTIVATSLALVLGASASGEGTREWISFDASPPGTAPTVENIAQMSSASKSVFHVELHGMWVQNKTIPGTTQTMQSVSLASNGALATSAVGLPELPGIPLRLACTQFRSDGGFSGESLHIVPLEQVVLDNYNIFPSQPQNGIDETGGDGEDQFYFDADFYETTTTPFPNEQARVLSGFHFNRSIPGVSCVATCMQSIPASRKLIVNTSFECTVLFEGQGASRLDLSPRAAAMFDLNYDNAPTWWQLNLAALNMNADLGDYLIVTANKYVNELWPLIQQKTERGLRVTIITTESLGSGFDHVDVKDAITNWYGGCDNKFEAYVLLIGDVDEMPMHIDPVRSLPSDHYYVCIEDELYPSCELGRYSVDSEQDLQEQIAKTMTYSETPLMFSSHYERSLLAAHEQESKNYVECIEDIASKDYWGYNPSFALYSGRDNTSTTAAVIADIQDTHYGLVLYRGHGWQFMWGDDWNILNEELMDTDVAGLTNGRYTPIMVAVACGNSHIDEVDDCIGETWMEGAQNGAVAHIGSIRSSSTKPNHHFARAFHTYYWSGYRLCVGEMMQDAWLTARMQSSSQSNAEKNIYMSQLLGDPELRPWQQSPFSLQLRELPQFVVGPNDYTFELDLEDLEFEPTDAMLMVLVNGEPMGFLRFDANGQADITLDLDSDSTVVLRARSELANAVDARYESDVDGGDTSCPADLDGNGQVEVDDLLQMIASWGGSQADLNGDGTTDVDDLLIMLGAFGPCS